MSIQSSRIDINRSAILAHIGAHGTVSRATLAKNLSLSAPLITQLTKHLIADGLLQELDHSPSQGGRRGRLLGLVSDAGAAIGVKVVVDHVTLVEVGIDGVVSRSATEPFDSSAATAVSHLASLLTNFITGSGSRIVLGVGVGVPGGVDAQGTGTVDSSQLGWHQVPLGQVLRRELSLPVLVENNVNALTMAETIYGQGRTCEDLLVVTIGTGVGAGIVVDGRIVRGHLGNAGEIGHIPVQADGPSCHCGNRGCLEAVIGQKGLVEQAAATGLIPKGADISVLTGQADAGDVGAQALFTDAGAMLGQTLASLVHAFDPEVVIILGEGVQAWRHWSYGFEPSFRSALMPRMRNVAVAVETWQDDSWAQGAAALVLATPFDSAGMAGAQGDLVRKRLVERASEKAER